MQSQRACRNALINATHLRPRSVFPLHPFKSAIYLTTMQENDLTQTYIGATS